MQALTGLDRGHLSRLERGLAGASDDTIRRCARALDVPTAAITHDDLGRSGDSASMRAQRTFSTW